MVKMKKQRRCLYIIVLFALLPFLSAFTRMEHSPYTNEYDDIEVNVNQLEPELYEFKVKNIGEGYIKYYPALHSEEVDIPNNSPEDTIFTYKLLAKPNDEVTFTASGDYSQYDFSNIKFYTTALVDVDKSVSFVGSKKVYQNEKSRWYFYIDCDIEGTSYDYWYSYVVTLEYDGVIYSVDTLTGLFDTNRKLYFYFSEPEVFDPSKTEVKEIVAFRYDPPPREKGIDYAGLALGGALYILVCYFLPTALIVAAVIATIIIVTRIIKKKRLKNNDKQ